MNHGIMGLVIAILAGVAYRVIRHFIDDRD